MCFCNNTHYAYLSHTSRAELTYFYFFCIPYSIIRKKNSQWGYYLSFQDSNLYSIQAIKRQENPQICLKIYGKFFFFTLLKWKIKTKAKTKLSRVRVFLPNSTKQKYFLKLRNIFYRPQTFKCRAQSVDIIKIYVN